MDCSEILRQTSVPTPEKSYGAVVGLRIGKQTEFVCVGVSRKQPAMDLDLGSRKVRA